MYRFSELLMNHWKASIVLLKRIAPHDSEHVCCEEFNRSDIFRHVSYFYIPMHIFVNIVVLFLFKNVVKFITNYMGIRATAALVIIDLQRMFHIWCVGKSRYFCVPNVVLLTAVVHYRHETESWRRIVHCRPVVALQPTRKFSEGNICSHVSFLDTVSNVTYPH